MGTFIYGTPQPRLAFTVRGRPVPMERARRGKHGQWYLPRRTRAYLRQVALRAGLARAEWEQTLGMLWSKVAAFYEVDIDIRTAGRGDLDNYIKSVADGCQGVLWDDDKRIAIIRCRRETPVRATAEGLSVTVTPYFLPTTATSPSPLPRPGGTRRSSSGGSRRTSASTLARGRGTRRSSTSDG
jgi:Holliday junction resolvase RusA-like endonuclease